MASPRHCVALATALHLFTVVLTGPLGPVPNVTSADMGFKEGSCALGDVVYLSGDEFPGSSPCERCTCSGGGVACAQQKCEPRPGCKALHRPDQCCPTYQCECEQEGRVYGNGEKLVDPADPCRVCYCQGGEMVCRRIACFVRDDCTPRDVPGRCCPEYDNCPLRGVTATPEVSSAQSISTIEEIKTSAVPEPPKLSINQQITIKEITPVSEIPSITEVKIKEILPSPSIDVLEYSSSKSPLIPREVTTEKSKNESVKIELDEPKVIAVLPIPENTKPKEDDKSKSNQEFVDVSPSKIVVNSFSTFDPVNSDIPPSVIPLLGLMGIPAITPKVAQITTTSKTHIIEEDDYHNIAFPPIPDDLSVLSNHGDDIVPEPSADTDHVHMPENIPVIHSTESEIKDLFSTTTLKTLPDTTVITTEKVREISTETTTKVEITSTEMPNVEESPATNLRSSISTEIISYPAFVQDEISETEQTTDLPTTTVPSSSLNPATTTDSTQFETRTTESSVHATESTTISKPDTSIPTLITEFPTTPTVNIFTEKLPKYTEFIEQTTSPTPISNIATEMTLQPVLSSLLIETSDPNPHEESDTSNIETEESTDDPLMVTSLSPSNSEIITVSRTSDNGDIDNVETTEFILTSFSSSESATDAYELIKFSGEPEKSANLIEPEVKNNNPLADLFNLVSDVASIGDHAEPTTAHSIATSVLDSEELIPVNAGYKSKNSNVNQNSITETPLKTKNPSSATKLKGIEIEDDDGETITDSSHPNDKVEPTTRRPIIDNVSDEMPQNNTQNSEKKDIEIITQSYVPTINRRPIKVIMKKNEEALAESTSASVTVVTSENTVASGEMTASTTPTPALDPSTPDDRVLISNPPEEPFSTPATFTQ